MAEKNDKDLDDLLDSALEDFKPTAAHTGGGDAPTSAAASGTAKEASADPSDADAFFLEQAKNMAERMSTLFGNAETPSGDLPPLPQDADKILSGFSKMAEAAAMTLSGENTANDDEVALYSESIANALKSIQQGTDSIANPASDDVANMFGALNLDGNAEGEGNVFLPFMEGMMQSLLSAEILLPSIKELLEKYPKYLAENAEKLSAEDKERYGKQMELYKTIEGHLEQERPDDNPTVKREKFKIVLEDMRKLQEFGQPPEEILAETAGDLPLFDPTSAAGNANPQCPMM